MLQARSQKPPRPPAAGRCRAALAGPAAASCGLHDREPNVALHRQHDAEDGLGRRTRRHARRGQEMLTRALSNVPGARIKDSEEPYVNRQQHPGAETWQAQYRRMAPPIVLDGVQARLGAPARDWDAGEAHRPSLRRWHGRGYIPASTAGTVIRHSTVSSPRQRSGRPAPVLPHQAARYCQLCGAVTETRRPRACAVTSQRKRYRLARKGSHWLSQGRGNV